MEQNGILEDNRLTGEQARQLWAAVLLQAFLDSDSTNKFESKSAHEFLSNADGGLESICVAIGVDFKSLQQRLKDIGVEGMARAFRLAITGRESRYFNNLGGQLEEVKKEDQEESSDKAKESEIRQLPG